MYDNDLKERLVKFISDCETPINEVENRITVLREKKASLVALIEAVKLESAKANRIVTKQATTDAPNKESSTKKVLPLLKLMQYYVHCYSVAIFLEKVKTFDAECNKERTERKTKKQQRKKVEEKKESSDQTTNLQEQTEEKKCFTHHASYTRKMIKFYEHILRVSFN